MAPRPTEPNPENVSLAELEIAAKAAASKREQDRLMAIKALILGADRTLVCKLFEISRRTVRRWVQAFNACGIDGLREDAHPGRPRKIVEPMAHHCRVLLEHPEQAGQIHWTGVKFHGYLRRELELEVGYSTVIRFLHEEGFRLKVPQPWPDRQDETLRQAFREKIKELLQELKVDLWFGDESGFEGDPRPRRRWAKKGEKARVTKNGDHIRMNVTGVICPRTGQFYALEFSPSDTDIFQAFLDHANRDLTFERPRNLLIIDNASWHKAKRLAWGRFEPLYLPPYSPDLNPIERLWLLIKAEWFTDFIAKTKDELIARLDQALNWVIQRQDLNKKTCAIRS